MSRRARWALVVCCALVLAALIVADVVAQEPVRYPLWYVINHEVCPKKMTEYRATMAVIVDNLKKHENANLWAAYTQATGGPNAVFHYLLAMEKMGDVDGWTAPDQALVDVMGADEAAKALRALGETTTPEVAIWGIMDPLSNPAPAPSGVAPEVAYNMRIEVPAGRGTEFAQIMAKIVAAYQGQGKAAYWDTSRCLIGNEGLEYSVFIPLDSYGDVDDWPDMPEVVAAQFGGEEAAAILAAMTELAMVESHFLELVPELSNLPQPE